MSMRQFSFIVKDIFKAIIKKFKKDKLFIFKLVMYSAYVYISNHMIYFNRFI